MLAEKLKTLTRDFVGVIYPNLCVVCNGHLLHAEIGFCVSCEQELPRSYDELNPENNPLIRTFWGRIPVRSAGAAFVFSAAGSVHELVHNLKYNGRKDAGIAAGQLYGSVLRGISPFLTADMILPVPLHESKLASRGYNQAACFGRGLADAMGIPMYENVLMRVKATASQTRKNREQRWENVGEVFGVRIKKRVEGKHIILVDDVVTTGATIESCAAPLLGIPGTSVSIVSLAAARQ